MKMYQNGCINKHSLQTIQALLTHGCIEAEPVWMKFCVEIWNLVAWEIDTAVE